MNIEELSARVEALEATRAAFLIAVSALIQTHPQPNKMQLHMTSLLEQQLGDGALGKTLNVRQQHAVREVVEWMGALSQTGAPGRQTPPT